MMLVKFASSQPKAQAQWEPISLGKMVMVGIGGVFMSLRSGVLRIHINTDMAVPIGVMRMVGVMRMMVPVLQIGIVSHRNHPDSFSTNRFFCTLNVFVVAIYQEIRTVLFKATIIWISETPSWCPEIAIPHSISHFIGCNVARDLHQNQKRKVYIKGTRNCLVYFIPLME